MSRCCLSYVSDSLLDHNALCGLCPFTHLLYTNMIDAGTLLLLAAVAPGSVLESFLTCRD